MSGSKVIFDDTKNPELTSNLDHSHMSAPVEWVKTLLVMCKILLSKSMFI